MENIGGGWALAKNKYCGPKSCFFNKIFTKSVNFRGAIVGAREGGGGATSCRTAKPEAGGAVRYGPSPLGRLN